MRWIILLFLSSSVFCSPPQEIPSDLFNEYTLGGRIPVRNWYIDETYFANRSPIFTPEAVDGWIYKVQHRGWGCYLETDEYLYDVLDKYISFISNKTIGIIGSVNPWYESMILAYGGKPVTIDYNKIINSDPRIRTMTVEEYKQNPEKFDAILSISSIEHDGLGRYGDPLNPRGDLEAMQSMKAMLKKGGLLFLSVPVGQDCIWWTAHRVYGPLRIPLLLEGWEWVDSSGFKEQDLLAPISNEFHQPVFVLKPL